MSGPRRVPNGEERLVGRRARVEYAAYLYNIEVDRITITTSHEHRLDITQKAAALLEAWRTPVRW